MFIFSNYNHDDKEIVEPSLSNSPQFKRKHILLIRIKPTKLFVVSFAAVNRLENGYPEPTMKRKGKVKNTIVL